MKNKLFFLILLLSQVLFHCQSSIYEKLIEEEATEEYCTKVINNYVALLKETYVFLDFYKSPIQSKDDKSYSIEPLDLVAELEAIPRKNRKFYDFNRDIQKIIKKTGDGHLNFYPQKSPGGINLGLCIFSLPFQFDVIDELDNEGNLKETYLTIREKEKEKEYEEENDNEEKDEKGKENEDEKGKENEDEKENEKRSLSSEYEKYYNKKIKSINGEYPFTFINNLFKDYKLAHSPQSHYVRSIHLANEINIIQYPFLKEELSEKNYI